MSLLLSNTFCVHDRATNIEERVFRSLSLYAWSNKRSNGLLLMKINVEEFYVQLQSRFNLLVYLHWICLTTTIENAHEIPCLGSHIFTGEKNSSNYVCTDKLNIKCMYNKQSPYSRFVWISQAWTPNTIQISSKVVINALKHICFFRLMYCLITFRHWIMH